MNRSALSRPARIVVALLAAAALAGAASPAAATTVEVPVVPGVLPPESPDGSAGNCYGRFQSDPVAEYGEICIARQADKVYAYANYVNYEGRRVTVGFVLTAKRCRVSDNVCVVIADDGGYRTADEFGRASLTGDRTTQTWSDRYYYACGRVRSLDTPFALEVCTERIV